MLEMNLIGIAISIDVYRWNEPLICFTIEL